jgi:hypothetical protein
MPSDDWWTGSPEAGVRRAAEMGGLPPPGSLPAEQMNLLRMTPSESRGDVWNYWGQQAAQAQREEAAEAQRSQLQQALERIASYQERGQRKKKKKPTMQDAGDALATAPAVRSA